MNEELTGTYVLVHPELHDDPAGKQNQVGIITAADVQHDDIFVSFGEGEQQALYSADALLIFLPEEEIHRHLADMAYDSAWPDLKALTQIDLFLRYGSAGKQRTALELAQNNPNIHQFCLDTLENQLALNQAQNRGR